MKSNGLPLEIFKLLDFPLKMCTQSFRLMLDFIVFVCVGRREGDNNNSCDRSACFVIFSCPVVISDYDFRPQKDSVQKKENKCLNGKQFPSGALIYFRFSISAPSQRPPARERTGGNPFSSVSLPHKRIHFDFHSLFHCQPKRLILWPGNRLIKCRLM